MILAIGARNFIRTLGRQAPIGFAISLAAALIVTISGISAGAIGAVKDKAARYFSGHASVTGYTNANAQINRPDAVIEWLETSDLPIRTIARRTGYTRLDAVLSYNGDQVRQRKLVGIDFAVEREEFRRLSYKSGSAEAIGLDGHEFGILISQPAARILSCRSGDKIELSLTTDSGQHNTASLIVEGVFDEASLFGYVAYLPNSTLNALLLRADYAASDIAVYARTGRGGDDFAEAVRNRLAEAFPTYAKFSSRAERDVAVAAGGPEKFAVLSQSAQLDQIGFLLDALLLVSRCVLVGFVFVTMIGVSNSYRVMVFERTKEIGTMRALGLQGPSATAIILVEAALLSIACAAAGSVVGIASLIGISSIPLAVIPGSGLVTEAGRLRFEIPLAEIGVSLSTLIIAVVLSSIGPARRASRIEPAEALRDAS